MLTISSPDQEVCYLKRIFLLHHLYCCCSLHASFHHEGAPLCVAGLWLVCLCRRPVVFHAAKHVRGPYAYLEDRPRMK